MNNELKQIKKKYGERMMKLCRSLFPTILNEEGKLIEILDSTFGHPKYLYDDIMEKKAINSFKNFIYSKYENENNEKKKTSKTPFQLMKEVGYTLYECKSEEDIMKFRKYYIEDEELCTFKWGNRLDTNYVFFAVKDNVDDIKRKNFKSPQRQDEYGTSVISIQFSRGDVNTLSIKNRYNHTVSNPDATFDNDLENIIPGLTNSFEKYYELNINQNESVKLGLDYIRANDGKYYKYNMEINNVYYCPDNIIIDNGEVVKDFIDKEKYLVIDNFILNLQNNNIDSIYRDKSITQYDYELPHDCFQDDLQYFDKINIIKNDDGTKTIELIKNDENPVYINIDKCNNIIGYTNLNIKNIGHFFLRLNRKLKKISIDNVEKIGQEFLNRNEKLKSLKLPKVISIDDHFLANCSSLETIELENVKKIKDCFLYWNRILKYLYAPNLENIGHSFLYCNKSLESLLLPKTKEVGESFLETTNISYIDIPNLECIGNNFMSLNRKLTIIDFPKLEMLKTGFLQCNDSLRKINLPNVTIIGDKCLECADIEEISMPKVTLICDYFMDGNIHLKKIHMPKLKQVGNRFLYRNKDLNKIEFPKLEIVGDNFIVENYGISNVQMPQSKEIGRNFLYNNICLKNIYLPMVNNINESFLANNQVLEEIYIPRLNLCNIPKDFCYRHGKLIGLEKTNKTIK